MGFFDNIGAGLFGGDPMADAGRQAQENYQRAVAEQRRSLGMLEASNTRAMNDLDASLANTMGAFDRAENQLRAFGDIQRRDILRGENQTLAANQSSAVGRGLFNTTVLDAMQRGTRQETGDQLARLGSSEANTFAALQTDRANAESAILGQQAALQNQAAMRRANQQAAIAQLTQSQPVFPDYQAMAGQQQVGGIIGSIGSIAAAYVMAG